MFIIVVSFDRSIKQSCLSLSLFLLKIQQINTMIMKKIPDPAVTTHTYSLSSLSSFLPIYLLTYLPTRQQRPKLPSNLTRRPFFRSGRPQQQITNLYPLLATNRCPRPPFKSFILPFQYNTDIGHKARRKSTTTMPKASLGRKNMRE